MSVVKCPMDWVFDEKCSGRIGGRGRGTCAPPLWRRSAQCWRRFEPMEKECSWRSKIPTKLARDVLKNTSLKIMHRLVAKDDRDMLGDTHEPLAAAETPCRGVGTWPCGALRRRDGRGVSDRHTITSGPDARDKRGLPLFPACAYCCTTGLIMDCCMHWRSAFCRRRLRRSNSLPRCRSG